MNELMLLRMLQGELVLHDGVVTTARELRFRFSGTYRRSTGELRAQLHNPPGMMVQRRERRQHRVDHRSTTLNLDLINSDNKLILRLLL